LYVLGVCSILGECCGLIAIVVALECVADRLNASVGVRTSVNVRNVSIVGVDAREELAVLGNHVANRDGALVLTEARIHASVWPGPADSVGHSRRAVTARAIKLAKVLDAVRIDLDSS
jgi:hypothetical protein